MKLNYSNLSNWWRNFTYMSNRPKQLSHLLLSLFKLQLFQIWWVCAPWAEFVNSKDFCKTFNFLLDNVNHGRQHPVHFAKRTENVSCFSYRHERSKTGDYSWTRNCCLIYIIYVVIRHCEESINEAYNKSRLFCEVHRSQSFPFWQAGRDCTFQSVKMSKIVWVDVSRHFSRQSQIEAQGTLRLFTDTETVWGEFNGLFLEERGGIEDLKSLGMETTRVRPLLDSSSSDAF